MGSYYRSVLLPANNNMQFFQFQNPQVLLNPELARAATTGDAG